MANLFFPQLASGAIAQYPIQKTTMFRTVRNQMPDGTLLLYSDPNGAHRIWKLEFVELSNVDIAALQAHFTACAGPLHAFTFIDPTGNMLAWSTDVTNPVWNAASQVAVTPAADPNGGSSAFTLTNNGQIAQGLTQNLTVPANYQYCFSAYVRSTAGANVTLVQAGIAASAQQSFAANGAWTRVVMNAWLNDPGTTYGVQLLIDPGQQCDVFGLQLEAQIAPSRYIATGAQGGVYANAHWGVDQLPVVATAPGQFGTTFTIETTV